MLKMLLAGVAALLMATLKFFADASAARPRTINRHMRHTATRMIS